MVCALIGSSQMLAFGPDSSLSPLRASAVLSYLHATGAEWGLGKGEPPGISATPES
ncbi:unannotated protein [freshwater metagenome]|uniref:Unannotated protein n=1 Tax=freshwater metagenome TaxID=449393 RepID=A0A6J7TXF8_9ZZZZ